jgi:hypothetical protein
MLGQGSKMVQFDSHVAQGHRVCGDQTQGFIVGRDGIYRSTQAGKAVPVVDPELRTKILRKLIFPCNGSSVVMLGLNKRCRVWIEGGVALPSSQCLQG